MAMALMHFTPHASLHGPAACRARLNRIVECSCASGNWENFHFRCASFPSSSSKLYEHVVGLSTSVKLVKRGLQRGAGLVSRSFVEFEESRLGNLNLVQRRCRRVRSWCVSAKAGNPRKELQGAEDLREQLEALQQEAEQVRGKANSARMRFMRLTHVVEQLRQRAAMDVRMGKEDSARLLLTEKQKVMKALEAARQRAELLEQLAGKLNVAISMKETLLIAALSSAPLSRSEAADGTAVHHVSPRTEGISEETIQSGVDQDEISFRAGLKSGNDVNMQGNADHSLD